MCGSIDFLKVGQMNENEMMQDDEISLFDLWEKLKDGWRYVVGGTVLGLAGAGAALIVLPPKYEAVAVVQVGQVGQVGQSAALPSEPPTQTIERMKTPSFQRGVAEVLGDQIWIDELSRSSAATSKYLSLQLLKASVVPGAVGLIELKASADSVEKAKSIAEVSIRELAKKQDEISKPMVDKMRADLSIAKEKLASAEKELDGLNKMMMNVGVKDDRFTQLSLITSLRVQKEAEVFAQRQAIMALETALMPPATQSAKALEAIYVADKPVSPKKSLLLALGLIGGLLAGVVSVFFVDAWRRARTQRLNSTSA
jgi:uncharacterized protein involved in exopolysaccharide biosynthesis